MKTARQDLADRLAMLSARYAVAFNTPAVAHSRNYLEHAKTLEEGLWDSDKSVVLQVRAIVDPADMDRERFWATPLGRLLFAAGGYPEESLTRSAAALVLDCSRQWIHELVARGTLKAAPSRTAIAREVGTAEVRHLLKERLDKAVK